MDQVISRIQAEAKSLGAPQGDCPRCDAACCCFRRHDSRWRKLLVVIDGFVVCCVLILLRWKCSICHKTFTHYPERVVPYKRYSLDVIFRLSQEYAKEDESSYRSVVRPEGQALGYKEGKDGQIDERQLSHSTLWRWLGWLGEELKEVLGQGLSLLKQKVPEFSLHRQLRPIPAKKYRSLKRKNLLERALLLLVTAPEFRREFGRTIFPTKSNSCWPQAG